MLGRRPWWCAASLTGSRTSRLAFRSPGRRGPCGRRARYSHKESSLPREPRSVDAGSELSPGWECLSSAGMPLVTLRWMADLGTRARVQNVICACLIHLVCPMNTVRTLILCIHKAISAYSLIDSQLSACSTTIQRERVHLDVRMRPGQLL